MEPGHGSLSSRVGSRVSVTDPVPSLLQVTERQIHSNPPPDTLPAATITNSQLTWAWTGSRVYQLYQTESVQGVRNSSTSWGPRENPQGLIFYGASSLRSGPSKSWLLVGVQNKFFIQFGFGSVSEKKLHSVRNEFGSVQFEKMQFSLDIIAGLPL